jgi:transcriptional regulator with XRE-family HTH domain
MVKQEFGALVRRARMKKGLSLRGLADRVALDYSRLARIEHGRRPPPDLMTIRLLAEVLDLDLADLVVAAGTSQEVVRHLLWAERLHGMPGGEGAAPSLVVPTALRRKNRFAVPIASRDGALCTARLGEEMLRLFFFDEAAEVIAEIPPEAVMVSRGGGALDALPVDNRWAMSIVRVRRLGQVTNLVLEGRGFELNALYAADSAVRLQLHRGTQVIAGVASTAVRVATTFKEGS